MMRLADALRLLVLGAIWGASFLFIKVALRGFTPMQVVTGRVVVGALTLALLLKLLRVPWPAERRTWGLLTFMAVIANLLPFVLISWGEQYTTSAMGALLNSTTPLFTAVFAGIVLPEERFNPTRAAGIVMGFAGIVLIVGGETGGSLAGQLAIVLAAALYGIGFTFSRRFLAGAVRSPLALPAAQLVIASALSLPIAVGEALVSRAPTFGWLESLSLFVLGAFGTGIAFFVYYRLIQDVGATTASFVTFLIPVFGVALGAVVLQEHVGWNTLAGAAVVIAGIALAESGARRAASGLQGGGIDDLEVGALDVPERA